MSAENNEKIIRVGSRKSELALIQTKHVITRLQKLYPERKFEIHTMSTIGDRVLNVSLPKIGEKSLFTRDLEDALRNGGVDFVVHSLKDLPTALPSGMAIGAVLEREDCRDALVLNEKYKGHKIDTLPKGSIIGTSSLRRTAQIRRKYRHLEVCDIRGNLNTRLAKLDALTSKFAGIILAQAGLVRMGWHSRISQILEPTDLLYAVGQGALAVECRSNDNEILVMLQKLMCLTTTCQILAERSFLKTLGGGCSAPVAVCTNLNGNVQDEACKKRSICLSGAVWSLDGVTEIQSELKCSLSMDGFALEQQNIEDGPSPSKRSKPNNDNENDDNDNDKSIQRKSSPKVVNDDKFPNFMDLAGGSGDNNLDIQYLINVHGELFKRCPFYTLHQKDIENGNTCTKKDECPLKIPVGQDFMGKCPYVDIEQKVELSEKGSCPVTGKMLPQNKNNSNTNNNSNINNHSSTNNHSNNSYNNNSLKIDELNNSSDNEIDLIKKCPFTGTTSKVENIGEPKGHGSCPFLKNQIKLIDYADGDKPPQQFNVSLNECEDELFCGLYRHECYSKNLYQKCNELGRNLAESLIRVGALEVMKKAQDEIHSKA